MTTSFRLYFLIMLAGFFLIPGVARACEMGAKKSCCTEKHSCCCTNKELKQESKTEKSCDDGKCKDMSCTCSTSSVGSSMFILAFYEISITDFYSNKKEQKFYTSEDNLSSGFFSLWLIPKIS